MEVKNTHYYDSRSCGTAIDSGLVHYDCPYKLPCGYCRILMQDCIKLAPTYKITCASSNGDNNERRS